MATSKTMKEALATLELPGAVGEIGLSPHGFYRVRFFRDLELWETERRKSVLGARGGPGSSITARRYIAELESGKTTTYLRLKRPTFNALRDRGLIEVGSITFSKKKVTHI